MRLRIPSLLVAIGGALCVVSASPASAGMRLVQGEGYAAIAGNDVAGARKAALAEALYNAAGRVKSKVRGAGHLSTYGVMTEETSVLVEGTLRDHRIVSEHRERGRYVVVIEALADADGESCGTKKVDLDVRPITVRVAPGLSGAIVKAANESINRGVSGLAAGSNFRATDNRDMPLPGGPDDAARNYAHILNAAAPNPSGYMISGSLIVERRRGGNAVMENTEIVGTLTLKLRDNATGSVIETLVNTHSLPERNRVWGTDIDFGGSSGSPDFAPLWQSAVADLDAKLGCRPLRAKVLDVNAGLVTLSAGAEHGIRAGDYFLLDVQGRRSGNWQVIKIEQTSPTMAWGRTLKTTPAVPVNAMVTLLQ